MRQRFRFPLWLLPILGFIFGIIYVFMFVHGLTATWALIGKPSTNISEILGDDGQTNLFINIGIRSFYFTINKGFPLCTMYKEKQ